MTHKLLNLKSDYSVLENWWKERDMVPIPKSFLTPFGVIVGDDKPIAAAFLFPVLGCKQAMIRYPITDVNASDKDRDEAISLVLSSLHGLAKSMNYETILITTNHNGFIKRLEKMNYQKDAENCTHYLGGL